MSTISAVATPVESNEALQPQVKRQKYNEEDVKEENLKGNGVKKENVTENDTKEKNSNESSNTEESLTENSIKEENATENSTNEENATEQLAEEEEQDRQYYKNYLNIHPYFVYDLRTYFEGCKLEDKDGFPYWNKKFLNYVSIGPRGLKEYLSDTLPELIPDEDFTKKSEKIHCFERCLFVMLNNSVELNIHERVHLSGMFRKSKKHMYLWICEEYGKLNSLEKIDKVDRLLDKTHDPEKSIDLRFSYFGELWNFLHGLDEPERECLKHLLWIYPHLDEVKYKFWQFNSPLTEKKLKHFVEDSPKFASLSHTRNTPTSNGRNWKIQCYNCYGLGHKKANCTSPKRTLHIPDLEQRLFSNIRRGN